MKMIYKNTEKNKKEVKKDTIYRILSEDTIYNVSKIIKC